jgi:transcriptional regulator with XRE-family HTH domain
VDETIGARLKRLREAKEWSLSQLAERSETSRGWIWQIEADKTRRPSADKLVKLAAALNTTPDYLMGVDDSEEASKARLFLNEFNKLSPKLKSQIWDIMRILAKEE